MKTYGTGLHVHHKELFETLTEPIGNREEYIKKEKPEDEQPVRLKALRKLTKKEVAAIPKGLLEARMELEKALEAWKKAREKAWKAWETWEEAQRSPEAMAWHKSVCDPDCPWNGATLFPNKSE